jgi:hypothetical protein
MTHSRVSIIADRAVCAQISYASSCEPTCSADDDAKLAEDAVDVLPDWAAVAKFYDRFRQCDDGGVAEGLSDSIGKLLARERPEMNVLMAVARSRRGMDQFVLRHVNETLSNDNLSAISEKLPARCEQAAKHLCRDISIAARRASTAP